MALMLKKKWHKLYIEEKYVIFVKFCVRSYDSQDFIHLFRT